MTDKFDNLIKSAIEGLDEVPNVHFEEEKIWKLIGEKISSSSGNKFYKLLFVSDLIILGLFLAATFATTDVMVNAHDILQKVEVYQKGVVIDTKISIETNQPNINRIVVNEGNSIVKNPKKTIKIKELDLKPITTGRSNIVSSKGVLENGRLVLAEETKSFNKAIIHIYRPRRYVGSGLVFKLKANGIPINKVRNGKHTIVELHSGPTQFLVGKQKLNIDLNQNETYYLRISYTGFPIGKPNLEWIAKDFAERELSESHIILVD